MKTESENNHVNQINKNGRGIREYTFSFKGLKDLLKEFNFSPRKIRNSLKNFKITVQWPHGRFAESIGNWFYDWGPSNYIIKEITSSILYNLILNLENKAKMRINNKNKHEENHIIKTEKKHTTTKNI